MEDGHLSIPLAAAIVAIIHVLLDKSSASGSAIIRGDSASRSRLRRREKIDQFCQRMGRRARKLIH